MLGLCGVGLEEGLGDVEGLNFLAWVEVMEVIVAG